MFSIILDEMHSNYEINRYYTDGVYFAAICKSDNGTKSKY